MKQPCGKKSISICIHKFGTNFQVMPVISKPKNMVVLSIRKTLFP